MNIHEYQAKSIFSTYGLPILRGELALSADESLEKAKLIGGNAWVVKAQILAGGRGKAGGIKIAKTLPEVFNFSKNLLGQILNTNQAQGEIVNKVYIEEACDIAREFYLSLLLDRVNEKLCFIIGGTGGMDIENIAIHNAEQILKFWIDPLIGIQPFHSRKVSQFLNTDNAEIGRLLKLIYKIFLDHDCSLIEINPLALNTNNELVILDAKMSFDDNAMFRQPKIIKMANNHETNPIELLAQQNQLNYIKLDGSIGCMVNGAGLAMATMDIIQLCGAKPSNFLDVGGSADKERVAIALKIILNDPQVKAILVNIFGGIMKCDIIALGIIEAVKDVKINVPMVVRLEGTNMKEGHKILANSGLKIIVSENLQDAAQKVVNSIKQ